ncbi:serine hydrolase, partial [Klebsiella pneumoniae]
MNAEFTATADAVLQQALSADAPIPGVVAMVTDRTGNVYERAAGKRSIDSDESLTIEDTFALFSCTKAVTATAALQLVESE